MTIFGELVNCECMLLGTSVENVRQYLFDCLLWASFKRKKMNDHPRKTIERERERMRKSTFFSVCVVAV